MIDLVEAQEEIYNCKNEPKASGIKGRRGILHMEEEQKSQIMVCMLCFVTPTDKNASVKKRKNQSANKLMIF